MATKTLQIHSQNILPIIKRWLYSDREIFARELIANATDAVRKAELLGVSGPYRVDVRIDKANRRLTFSDNGIGMSLEEVEKYIAQIAFSGAEEFLSHYGDAKDQGAVIGHFGLGFYSAYMVAGDVEIQTKSHRADEPPAHWSCAGESEYTLETGSRTDRGTDVILHVTEEGAEYLEEAKLREILTRYCAFLPYPIYLNDQQVTLGSPLWLKSAKEANEREYIEFYQKLYPHQPDPLFWIHLDVEFPFTLKGILYFPRITGDFDPSRSPIKLYCNRVFVAEDCKEILPEFLMPLKGALDSPDIPLNVARSSLQIDKKVRQIAGHISKKVSDRLRQLQSEEREKFLAIWPDIQWVVKVGALQDEKFYERVSDWLIWQEVGGEYRKLSELVKQNPTGAENKVHYTFQGHAPSSVVQLYLDRGLKVIEAHPLIDPPLFALIERKSPPTKFLRIDSALDESLLDKGREKTLLDSEGKTQGARIAEFFQRKLGIDQLQVEAKSFQGESVAGVLVIDEQIRRMRDTWQRQNPPKGNQSDALPPWLPPGTFVVNTNHPLVERLLEVDAKRPELSGQMATHLYELALFAQNELPEIKRGDLARRSLELMQQLASAVE